MRKILSRTPMSIIAALIIVGCGMAVAEKPRYQLDQEQISNKIAEQLTKAVPYPVDAMRDSLERRQLRERLLRFNKPTKIGYLYMFNLGGREPVGYYVVKGKVSSVQSDMSNPDQTWNHKCTAGNSGCAYLGTAESIGDDGSWGNNEGGSDGIFFFDSNGVLHESAGLAWHYADAPVDVWKNTPNLTARSKPSSTSSFWQKQGGLGG